MFPTNIEGIKESIASQLRKAEAAAAKICRLKTEIEGQEEIAETSRDIAVILNGLVYSPHELDPGKYRDAYFFLIRTNGKRAAVENFFTGSKETCPYPVVRMLDIEMDRCDQCQTFRPVIERYVQTEDRPDGDEWLRERLILCLDCNHITIVNTENRSERFY
jgi:hypothetical protein